MKERTAYNLLTGEIVVETCSKAKFHRLVHEVEKFNRETYGLRSKWTFKCPWA